MLIGIDASRAALAHHTGIETYAYQLIRAMASLSQGKARLRLYAHQPPQRAPWPDGPYVETRIIPFPRLWTHLRLAAEVSRHPPDVLFVPAHVLPLYCPVPAVVTVHDLAYRHHPETYTGFQRRYLDWSTRRHARVARHLIADSAATRDDLLAQYDADPAKISVVHLGRDPSLQPMLDPAATLAKYQIEGQYILYIGTLQPRKNLLRLVEAFHAIHDQVDARLVLAGEKGWLYDQIFARVQALNLNERVIFPGFVAEADKAALISGAAVYAYPSLYEGFGLPILEAMACGTPVLSSNSSSMPEVAGEAALLVDPYRTDAITAGLLRLLTDDALRADLAEKGFQQVQRFSWEKAARRTLDILLDCGA